jgi:hypothetical protein
LVFTRINSISGGIIMPVIRQIEYSKLVSMGDYNNEKIGIVVELEQGDSENEIMARAKAWVNHHLFGDEKPTEQEVLEAEFRKKNAQQAIDQADKVIRMANEPAGAKPF